MSEDRDYQPNTGLEAIIGLGFVVLVLAVIFSLFWSS